MAGRAIGGTAFRVGPSAVRGVTGEPSARRGGARARLVAVVVRLLAHMGARLHLPDGDGFWLCYQDDDTRMRMNDFWPRIIDAGGDEPTEEPCRIRCIIRAQAGQHMQRRMRACAELARSASHKLGAAVRLALKAPKEAIDAVGGPATADDDADGDAAQQEDETRGRDPADPGLAARPVWRMAS